ncbi:hypothetical protein os1_24750 [Comamonadaceae bacterium OS-1]|nr:hypothetical protein os1_24750 [Comamonadaceae bacterium OS-1]
MLDPLTLSTLASATVAFVTPLLGKALDKGVEEVGKAAAGSLLGRLKERLAPTPAKVALDDATQDPADPDNQAALRVQLKKALQADPALADFLQKWLDDGHQQAAALGLQQTATVTGSNNKTVQIHGSGNSVS